MSSETERARQRAKSARRRAFKLATDPEGFRLREAERLRKLRSHVKRPRYNMGAINAELRALFKAAIDRDDN